MEKSCFLFGHADAPRSILGLLEKTIEEAILKGTTVFYVGNHGSFDQMAISTLRALKHRHGKVTLILVLAYHPAEQPKETPEDFDGTFYPPLESVPKRYAIIRANLYMIKSVDCVICYVNHFGNARDLFVKAQKRSIEMINIGGLTGQGGHV